MAHETCKTLQPQGSPWEPTYGHGAPPLAGVLARLLRLAVWVDQAQQMCCAWCQAGWAQLGSTRLVWERRRAVCSPSALASRRQRFAALFYGLKQPPVFGFDSTASPAMPAVTACHNPTRRLASGVGQVGLAHTRSPFSASPPRLADRKSLFKRRHWRGETLWTLSTAMGLIRLLDEERELLASC